MFLHRSCVSSDDDGDKRGADVLCARACRNLDRTCRALEHYRRTDVASDSSDQALVAYTQDCMNVLMLMQKGKRLQLPL